MEKYISYYDIKEQIIKIEKVKILSEEKWGHYETSKGFIRKENIYNTLEEAEKKCKYSNYIII